MKILLTIVLSSLFSCGTAPKMEHEVLVWKGTPTVGGICKLSSEALKEMTSQNPDYYQFLVDPRAIVCIKSTNERFGQYVGISLDDIEVLQKYIVTLENSCKVWK